MLYRRQARILGRKIARELRSSITHTPDLWKVKPHHPLEGVTEIANSQFTVTIQRSRQLPAVRIFDRCSLSHNGCDVWLSLWQRIRLKNATRLWAAREATRGLALLK